jgi:acetoin utilization deacetylase AcuC-like enzyme
MPGHPERPERLLAIERRLGERGWLGWERREAPPASKGDVELVHSVAHVSAIRDLCARGGGAIDADTYAAEASWEAALRGAGGACAMVRALLGGEASVGFSATRPAGHHAERERAMGFCLFDNVAIAAELAIRKLGAERVLVIDWDVHHGNGTAEIFRRRGDVLVANIHQGGIFPGTGPLDDIGSGPGEGFTVNLPVPGGSGEEEWLSLLERIVIPVGAAFEPQLILISAGFDAHRADPLATCMLEAESFGRMARRVRVLAGMLDAPVGAVLEGGYDVDALAESVAATLAALGDKSEVGAAGSATDSALTSHAAAQIGRYWDL